MAASERLGVWGGIEAIVPYRRGKKIKKARESLGRITPPNGAIGSIRNQRMNLGEKGKEGGG